MIIRTTILEEATQTPNKISMQMEPVIHGGQTKFDCENTLVPGETYTVVLNGNSYEYAAKSGSFYGMNYVYLGTNIYTSTFTPPALPFFMVADFGNSKIEVTLFAEAYQNGDLPPITLAIYQETNVSDDESVSYGAYLANPKYRFSPFRGFFGWLMNRNGGA